MAEKIAVFVVRQIDSHLVDGKGGEAIVVGFSGLFSFDLDIDGPVAVGAERNARGDPVALRVAFDGGPWLKREGDRGGGIGLANQSSGGVAGQMRDFVVGVGFELRGSVSYVNICCQIQFDKKEMGRIN